MFFYSWSALSVISFSFASCVAVNNIIYKALLVECRDILLRASVFRGPYNFLHRVVLAYFQKAFNSEYLQHPPSSFLRPVLISVDFAMEQSRRRKKLSTLQWWTCLNSTRKHNTVESCFTAYKTFLERFSELNFAQLRAHFIISNDEQRVKYVKFIDLSFTVIAACLLHP